jgi:hypothetical protein
MKSIHYMVFAAALAGTAATAPAQTGKGPETLPFYVYDDQREHFHPTGLMGDATDLYVINASSENPGKGESCIKVTYSAKAGQGNRWAGIYWQEPAGNWGTVKDGGFNLKGAGKLKFLARGEKGGEQVEFKCGGIAGDHPDTFRADTTVMLGKEWKEVVIDLKGQDLSRVIGGFVFALNADKNPEGATFYIDEIRYEKQ